MPKMKTKSAAKKRFKKTGSGLFKRAKAFRRHLLTKKTTKRKRHLRAGGYISGADSATIEQLLPN